MSVDRRRFLQHTWSGVGASLSLALLPGHGLFAARRSATIPFTLGVASGDPTPDGIVLWTRLAPEPADPRQPRPARDSGRLARGDRQPHAPRRRARHGAGATPSSRIRCTSKSTACSPAATTSISSTCATRRARSATSAPRRRAHEMVREIRFAFATCQDWPSGYYTAYRDMLRNDLDLVLHLGDYTYEYAIGGTTGRGIPPPEGFEPETRGPAHVPAASHALQARSGSAGGAREVPVRGDLGRPRGRERLFGARARVGLAVARVHRAPRRGVPGLLRAHADPRCRVAQQPQPACASIGGCEYGSWPSSRCSTIGSIGPTIRAATASRCDAPRR